MATKMLKLRGGETLNKQKEVQKGDNTTSQMRWSTCGTIPSSQHSPRMCPPMSDVEEMEQLRNLPARTALVCVFLGVSFTFPFSFSPLNLI